MKRSDIINYYIKKNHYSSYLEIGYYDGINFSLIECAEKYAVDPNPITPCSHIMTSDDFFNANAKTFDIIFIDGLHHSEQVKRDIENSLSVLTKNGIIICHDMNPTDELMQRVPMQTGVWTGDCWKAFVLLRNEKRLLSTYVIDIDCGLGIISKSSIYSKPLVLNANDITYDNFAKNKTQWLNLISLEEWKMHNT